MAAGPVLSVPEAALEAKFRTLTENWKRAVRLCSSAADMAMHPAYQQIIGMGQQALPLILRELEREEDHWFWALRAITGENPVPADCQGSIPEMAKAWLNWGRQRGLV